LQLDEVLDGEAFLLRRPVVRLGGARFVGLQQELRQLQGYGPSAAKTLNATIDHLVHSESQLGWLGARCKGVQKKSSAGSGSLRRHHPPPARGARLDASLKGEELSERASMNASYLGFIERGDNIPTLLIIVHLAEAFEVDSGTLLADVMRAR
jgi:hypothetical protein